MYSEWNAFARTDVLEYPGSPERMAVFLDGGAGSNLYRRPRSATEEAALRDRLGYLPFRTGRSDQVLAIGPGGGEDVVLALLSGSKDVTAVEINPGAVQAVRYFGSYAGNLYDQPQVRVVVDEGRSFLRRSGEQYDVIYLAKAVTQAAEQTGLALAENYLYTVDAFDDYLEHLAPDGRLALILHDQYDLTRAATTALAALVNRGESLAEASRHLVLINDHASQPGMIMHPLLLLKRTPFTTADLEALVGEVVAGGFEPLYIPGVYEMLPFTALSQDNVSLASFISGVTYMDATPTTDDRPFFYAMLRGVPAGLLAVMATALALLLVGASWPLPSRRQAGMRPPLALFVYFVLLGTGFMVVEVAIIQRFSLFLGHPTLSLSVTLAALLLGGGIGGWISQKVPTGRLPMAVAAAALAIALLLLGTVRFVPWLTTNLLAAPLPGRVAVTLALVVPLGLIMGIPFPAGLRWLRGERHLASRIDLWPAKQGYYSVAWAWGVNGLASVLGSAGAVAISMLGGFSWSLLLGSVVYVGVFAWIMMYARPHAAGARESVRRRPATNLEPRP